MNLGAIIFSAIGLAVAGGAVVLCAQYAERWRAEDPQNREGKVPPAFEQAGKLFMWFILGALVLSIAIAVMK